MSTKQKSSTAQRIAAPRQAAANTAQGQPAPASSPRQQTQGTQIAQLMDGGGRKATGHSLGASHSTMGANGKTRSHQPGKGRTEDPRKSAALNRRRQRQIQANVANSIAKDQGSGK